MHDLADFEAARQHRREMAQQVKRDRLGRASRASRQDKGLPARLAGLLGPRPSGAARAAG